jgi:hypothetical protein
MRARIFLIAALVALAPAVLAACGSSNHVTIDAAPADAAPGPADAPEGPPDASCFTNPQTHREIINACTTAQSQDKHPTLPLQYSDGGLPPLPP